MPKARRKTLELSWDELHEVRLGIFNRIRDLTEVGASGCARQIQRLNSALRKLSGDSSATPARILLPKPLYPGPSDAHERHPKSCGSPVSGLPAVACEATSDPATAAVHLPPQEPTTMLNDASCPLAEDAAPSEPMPTADGDAEYVRASADEFSASIERQLARSVSAAEPFEAHVWFLARRHPVTKALYPDQFYGLFDAPVTGFGSEADANVHFDWIRKFASHAAAIGVAFVFKVRLQVPETHVSDDRVARTSKRLNVRGEDIRSAFKLLHGREAVFLNVEHRAFAKTRRRIALIPRGDALSRVIWVDFEESSLPIFHTTGQTIPSFLPPID